MVRHPRGRPAWFRPRLEGLEDRRLPSTVTNLADAGPGSLREAIATTDPGGTVDFEPGLAGTIALTIGTLTIAKDLTITGPGSAVITVSGSHASTVFRIDPTFDVAIAGLTVAEGAGASGGGISNDGTLTVTDAVLSDNTVTAADAASTGGGIANRGTLTLIRSTVSGNVAAGSNAGYGQGGGIWNAGTLTVTGSTLSGNAATAGGLQSSGGGIWNGGTLTVTDSTLSGNTATSLPYYGSLGGGIANSGTLTVSNSTFSGNTAGGSGGEGGGIWNSGTLSITGSTFNGNSATGFNGEGSGAWNSGTLSITGTTFNGNSASFGGGGIWNSAGISSIANSTLSGNSPEVLGGGMEIEGGTVIIVGSTLSRNTAAGMSGGIDNAGTLVVARSTLSDNTAETSAGGVYNDAGGRLTVTHSTLSGNSAGSNAGGIWNLGTATVTNSTLSGNTGSVGGGIFNLRTLTITNSTLSDNAAAVTGGGIDRFTGTVTIRNTIVAGNTAPTSPDVLGLLDSGGHNLIGDGSGGDGFTDTDLVGTPDQPVDPQLEPLGDYGGPTRTQRPLPSSPAVDAGDNADAPATDQRGFARIVNGVIDIGAVELQPDELGHLGGVGAVPLRSGGELPAAGTAEGSVNEWAATTWNEFHTDRAPDVVFNQAFREEKTGIVSPGTKTPLRPCQVILSEIVPSDTEP
jgi:hypothetical protein